MQAAHHGQHPALAGLDAGERGAEVLAEELATSSGATRQVRLAGCRVGQLVWRVRRDGGAGSSIFAMDQPLSGFDGAWSTRPWS